MRENLFVYSMLNHNILKVISVSILLILMAVDANAQDADYTWHLVAFENELEVAYYNTEVISSISISTTTQNVTVVLDDGISFSHQMATTTFGFDFRKAENITANEAMNASKWKVRYYGGRLYFSKPVNRVSVYNLYGALITQFTGSYMEVPVYLRQGIYALQAGGMSAKLLVSRNGYGSATHPVDMIQTSAHGLQIRTDGVLKTYWNLTFGSETMSIEMSKVERFRFNSYHSIVVTLKNGNTVELDDYTGMKFEVEPVWATVSMWNMYLTMLFGGFAFGVDESLPSGDRYNTRYVTTFSENEIICYDINNNTERRYPIGPWPLHDARFTMFRGADNILYPAYSYVRWSDDENTYVIEFLSIENGNLLWSAHASNWPNSSNLGKVTFSFVENENIKAVFEGGEHIFKHEPSTENVNANTTSNVYDGYFLFGSNMGWMNQNWLDEDVADILVGNASKNREGVGVTSLRPALPYYFVQDWGYDIKVNTFKYYDNIGAKENVVFIGDGPTAAHCERKQYTSAGASQSYENLYEPIWDNGENGTPVNDNNYYALYVYEIARRYKGEVKFWEIKNEPDLTYSDCGWEAPGSGCWWDRDPLPEELINWYAPIQSYIRLLRVSYEVIKSVDPEAFICVGGIGYASFLDAILRNTDNPDGGKVTEAYPLKGGAWFDCLSFHCYPMYNLRTWDNGIGWFRYFRHSDAAVNALKEQLDEHKGVLTKHGYADSTTKCN